MPLFEQTSRTYSIDDIIKTVFGSLDDKRLCMQQPMRVTYNSIFLINTKCVNVKDIVADGNSVFLNIGQPSVTVKVGNDMSFEVVARSKQKLKKEKFFRLYDVRDKEGNIVNDIVVVQYVLAEKKEKSSLHLMETQLPILCHTLLRRIRFESDYNSILQGTIKRKQLI